MGTAKIIPACAGIKKTVGIAFLFAREKDEQVSWEGFLEAVNQFGNVQEIVEIHQASQREDGAFWFCGAGNLFLEELREKVLPFGLGIQLNSLQDF